MDNYDNFLTNEDIFRMEIETYLPEFLQRIQNDTLGDSEFVVRSLKMMDIAEDAGINLQQYIIDYCEKNGLNK